MTIEKPIGYSVNTAVKNKPPSGDPMELKLGSGWDFKRWAEPRHLIEDVQAGYAVAPGWFTAGEKVTANFKQSQYWMLDFDKNISTPFTELHNHEWFSKNALFAYTTASYEIRGSYRIVGAWNKPIRSEEEFRAAGRYLHTLFPECDEAMERPAQCCYGNDGAQLITWDFTNRTELQLKERTPRRIKTGQDAFADIVRNLDSDSEELKIAKIKLCLQYIPERGEPSISNTYNNAWKTVCAVTHELGSDVALRVFDECGWHGQWDLEYKVHDAESSRRGDTLGIGSLIELVRQTVTGEELAAFNSRLDRINGAKKQERPKDPKQRELLAVDVIKQEIRNLLELSRKAVVEYDCSIEYHRAFAELRSSVGIKDDALKSLTLEAFTEVLRQDGLLARHNAGSKQTYTTDFFSTDIFDSSNEEFNKPLLPGFIDGCSDGLIISRPGQGKTTSAIQMSAAIVMQEGFLDHEEACDDANAEVLFISMDTSERDLRDTIIQQGLNTVPAFRERVHFWTKQGNRRWCLTLGHIYMLAEALKQNPNIRLVIFDTLEAIANGAVDIYKPEVEQWQRLLSEVCNNYGATSLILHHTTKDGGAMAGGAQIERACSFFHKLETITDDNGLITRKWCIPKMRGAEARSIFYKRDADDSGMITVADASDMVTVSVKHDILSFLRDMGKPQKRSEIMRQLTFLQFDHKEDTVSRTIKRLAKIGLVDPVERGVWRITGEGKKAVACIPYRNWAAPDPFKG